MDWTKNTELDLLRLHFDYAPLPYQVPAKVTDSKGRVRYMLIPEVLYVPVGYLRGRDATTFRPSP